MLRNATEADICRIAEIEAASFDEPWSASAIAEALSLPSVYVRVFDEGGVVGFIIFSLIAGEAEVYDLAVAPENRKRGVGESLLCNMLAAAKTAFLEVREGNAPARALYGKCGFKEIGIRKKYYRNGENAVVMTAEGEDKLGSCIGN